MSDNASRRWALLTLGTRTTDDEFAKIEAAVVAAIGQRIDIYAYDVFVASCHRKRERVPDHIVPPPDYHTAKQRRGRRRVVMANNLPSNVVRFPGRKDGAA